MHAPNDQGYIPNGPGLFAVTGDDGHQVITNIRRLAGSDQNPGGRVIAFATWLLAILGGGLMYVSFDAQYTYIFAVKHVSIASAIEAGMLDAGMIILSALGIGLALAGKPSRTERFLIMACSAASAEMNYAAAVASSWRSVLAYTAAPVFLAIIVDRVISVIRRHVLPLDAESAWTWLGRATIMVIRLAGVTALYLLRLALAPAETAKGLRRVVLDAAPLPQTLAITPPVTGTGHLPGPDPVPCPVHGIETPAEDRCAADTGTGQACGQPLPCPGHPAIMPPGPQAPPAFGSKREAFEWHYRRHPQFGDRQAMSQAAKEVGERVGLQWGTSRTYAAAILAADAISDAMDAARDNHDDKEISS